MCKIGDVFLEKKSSIKSKINYILHKVETSTLF